MTGSAKPSADLKARPGPGRVERLVVHQLDLARPAPGGIDTCIRGMIAHAPDGLDFAVVGVDSGAPVDGRQLGRWEQVEVGGRTAWFMPVARLDAGDQRRRIPHSVRLVLGLVRYWHRLPASRLLQAHRADVAASVRLLLRRPLAYMVHTQEKGLTGATSDSAWRRAAGIHARIEHALIRSAVSTTVFNPDFARTAEAISPTARFSPTWFEPTVSQFQPVPENPHEIVWVGRVEEPKDPMLAVRVLAELARRSPDVPWRLRLVGTGTLADAVAELVRTLPADVRERVILAGRLAPTEVASVMAGAGVFLMTSHPGYEGFPRVLLEAMSAGLPAVVTRGSDTGGVIDQPTTGEVCDRDPAALADAVERAVSCDRRTVRASVEQYSAPQVVAGILGARTG